MNRTANWRDALLLYSLWALLGFFAIAYGSDEREHDAAVKQALELEACQLDLQAETFVRSMIESDENRCHEDRLVSLRERDELHAARYDRLFESKAGLECWQRVSTLEQQLSDEKNFYYWRLKSCGAIRDKTPAAVRQYERKADELLSDTELARLEDN